MEPKKYLLSYNWKEGRDGHFFFHDHFETDSFIMAILVGLTGLSKQGIKP